MAEGPGGIDRGGRRELAGRADEVAPEPLWIFGYGSLVWRPAFPHVERRAAFVEGWARRFWQGSTDHRGVPGAPGRVVTLLERQGARTDGVAFRVAPESAPRVLAQLDVREKGGYARHVVELHLREPGEKRSGLVYVATSGNPNYLGPAGTEHIAAQVRGSRGPSGHNVEYVLRLAEAVRELGGDDPHLFDVESRVRES